MPRNDRFTVRQSRARRRREAIHNAGKPWQEWKRRRPKLEQPQPGEVDE